MTLTKWGMSGPSFAFATKRWGMMWSQHQQYRFLSPKSKRQKRSRRKMAKASRRKNRHA